MITTLCSWILMRSYVAGTLSFLVKSGLVGACAHHWEIRPNARWLVSELYCPQALHVVVVLAHSGVGEPIKRSKKSHLYFGRWEGKPVRDGKWQLFWVTYIKGNSEERVWLKSSGNQEHISHLPRWDLITFGILEATVSDINGNYWPSLLKLL